MEYELYHYGVLGMKWGIRRYQNKDGTLTAAGKKRYGSEKGQASLKKDISQIDVKIAKLESKPKTIRNAEEIEFLRKMQKALIEETEKYYESFSPDEKKFRELSTKNLSQLSTQDIQFLNNRIQAKNAYLNNTENQGVKFARTVATQVASQLAAEYLKAGTKAVLNWSGEKVSNFANRKSRKDQAWEDLLNNMKNHGGSNSTNNANNTTENNAKDKKKKKKGK